MKSMNDKLPKIKRKRVSWYDIYLDLGDYNMSQHYYYLMQKHPKMSKNRIAYYTLKTFFSAAAMKKMRDDGYYELY